MPGADTQNLAGLYKTKFEPFVAEMTNKKYPLTDLFKFEKAEFAGSDVTYNAHTTRNISPMWVGEDGAFADAGQQGSVKVSIGQRKLMARVRMTTEVMEDTMKSEGAFRSARRDEMTRIIDDIARMEEYSFTSDGRGILALIDDATPSGAAAMTVDAPGGITGDDFGNRFFLPGIIVGAVDPSTNILRAGVRKVASLSSDGTTITFTTAPPATWADNDFLVQAANTSVTDILDTSFEHAAYGLQALIDDGTYRANYFGVDRASYTQYQGYVKASTGTLSEDLFQQVADVVDQRLGGVIDRMTAHHSVRRLVIQITHPDRRYSGSNLMKPDAGTSSFTMGDIPFGGVPVKAIRTHALATLFGFDTKGVDGVRYVSDAGSWFDTDGNVFTRVGSGTSARDAVEAWYRKRYQNHFRNPSKGFRLDGITGQSLIVVREAGS